MIRKPSVFLAAAALLLAAPMARPSNTNGESKFSIAAKAESCAETTCRVPDQENPIVFHRIPVSAGFEYTLVTR